MSNTSSAYSSMDLQADDRISFIYEETLTGFGKRDNPVSTSFPTGSGQHNFDGFDNIYVAYDLEYITNGAYSVKRNVDQRAFVCSYFNALADETDMPAADREALTVALAALSEKPSPAELDAVYAVFAAQKPLDRWSGKRLTFTNVQQSGAERVLYINENNALDISVSSAEELGESAQFLCNKEASGKYSFFNEKAGLYMIWRAGGNYGYNNNSGTLAVYNSTYCDWSINQSSIADKYYIVSKRANGNDGSIILLSSGVFDAWSGSEGYSASYSNLFRIDVVPVDTSVEDVINECGNVNTVYDLTGRRIDSPGKGLYIIDGKKVLIR